MHSFTRTLVLAVLALAPAASLYAQAGAFTVTVVPPVHGKVQLSPALPADGKYPAGTVVTVSTTPDPGYALDSAWYSVPGRFGQMYHEGMTREFKVTIDQDKRIGASFIDAAAVKDLIVTNDVVYAKPGVKPLKYDVFAPKGARNLPMIVIIHGGGWTANDEDVMRGLARELTKGGKFVVPAWTTGGPGRPTAMPPATRWPNLIEDVFGGIAHIMEHAAQYGGDPTRIGVTGDSAGGHLSAAASLMTEHDRLARLRQDAGRVRVHAELSAEGQDGRAGARRDVEGDQGRGAELRRVRRRRCSTPTRTSTPTIRRGRTRSRRSATSRRPPSDRCRSS